MDREELIVTAVDAGWGVSAKGDTLYMEVCIDSPTTSRRFIMVDEDGASYGWQVRYEGAYFYLSDLQLTELLNAKMGEVNAE